MNRMIPVAVFSLFVAGFAHAQTWTPVSPDILHSTGAKVGVKVANPIEALEVNGQVKVTNGGVGVGGVAPAGYQFFATNSTNGVSSAFRLHSNYAFTSTSFIGNLGGFGTRVTHSREPQLGGFTDEALTNKAWAVDLSIGDSQRGKMFLLANYAGVGGAEVERLAVNGSGMSESVRTPSAS
jgi:hypothetical protein